MEPKLYLNKVVSFSEKKKKRKKESTLSPSQPSTQRIRAIAPPQPSKNQMGGFSHL